MYTSPTDDIVRYLRSGREALLWKLQGLSEYDVRRPIVPTGTNLLGLLKHAASTEAGYFGAVFGRPFPEPMPWIEDAAEDNADMWATPDQSRSWVVGFVGRVAEATEGTFAALPLDAPGIVPWWPAERREVTLHQIGLHMVAELHRHAGHADLVRELIDGAAGMRDGSTNLPDVDWSAHRERLEAVARQADVEGSPE